MIANYKVFALIFAGFAIVVLVLLQFSELSEIGRLFARTDPWWMVGALVLVPLNFFIKLQIYRTALSFFKLRPPSLLIFKKVIIAAFFNKVVPTLGVSDNAYLYLSFKKMGLPFARAALISGLETFTSFIAFSFLLLFAVIFLSIKGKVEFWQVWLVTLAIIITSLAWVFVYLVISRVKLMSKLAEFVNLVVSAVTLGRVQTKPLVSSVADLAVAKEVIVKEKVKFVDMFVLQIVMPFVDALIIFFLFSAIDIKVSYLVILASLVMGVFLGTISFIPASLGTFEGGMIFTLSLLAVPFEAAVIATVLFRAINYWLPIPFGFWLYRRELKKG